MESAQVILKHGIEQVKAVCKNETNENTGLPPQCPSSKTQRRDVVLVQL